MKLLALVVELSGSVAKPRVIVIPTAAGSPQGERSSFELWSAKFEAFTNNVEPLCPEEEKNLLSIGATRILMKPHNMQEVVDTVFEVMPDGID